LGKKKADGSVSLNTKLNPEACSSEPQSPTPNPQPPSQTVAVFDLGGGTFDVSILRLMHTDTGRVDQVLATAGDTHLGGDDVDRMIVELIQNEVREQFGEKIEFPASTRQAFRNFAEAMKVRLSNEDTAPIEVDLGADADGQPRVYRRTLTLDEFNAMIGPWVDRTITCCEQALRSAKCSVDDIDRVVMVGGSTRIPLVRRRVGELFKTEPYTALNPDEVVSLGAAVQGSILAGINRDMLLLDVIPLSLGIETMGGAVSKLIMANSTIPAQATEMFSTYVDGQTNIKLHILQGERELVADCRSLGEFELKGIPPMPAGLPKVEVTFLVDANGVLNVRAVEKRSEKRASIQIVPNHGLTREEVDRMEAESYAHAAEDMTAHRLIDLRNQARLDIRAIEKQLAKVGDEIDPAYRSEVEANVARVRALADAPDADADTFHEALDAMDKSTVRLAEMAIAKTLREEQDAPKR
jgi:molecular chaperone DnaK (HSP70)